MAVSSIHFGAENLIFVPERRDLRVFDLYHWRVMTLPVHSVRLRLRADAADRVRQSVREAAAAYLKTPDGRSRESSIEAAADRFLRGVVEGALQPEAPLAPPKWLEDRLAPARLTLWVRVSDAPLESYFEEDYDQPPESFESALGFPLFGSLVLSELGEAEIALPELGPEAGFQLGLPSPDSLRVDAIDPMEPLPILGEYCGKDGSSNQGHAATYNLQGRIAREKLGCVPLHRIGQGAFATLYLHLEFEPECDVLVRIRGKRLATARRTILSLGYSLAADAARFQIWEREGARDVLHLYTDIPGRESVMMPWINPFVLAAKASGGFDPAERSKLIGQLVAPGAPGNRRRISR